jgi:hypothetical protein
MAVSGQSGTSDVAEVVQRIENVRTLAGQTATFSLWAKADAAKNIVLRLSQNFGSGGSTSVHSVSTVTAITTSWARYSFTVSLPSVSGKTIGSSSFLLAGIYFSQGSAITPATGLGLQSGTFDIWGWQVEAGSVATAFQTATGTIQGELAACQRYYYRTTIDEVGGRIGSGYVNGTTEANITIPFPVQMRTKPTALEQSGTATDYQVLSAGNVSTTCNLVPAFVRGAVFQGVVQLPVASGIVAGQGVTTRFATVGAFFGWSAEL